MHLFIQPAQNSGLLLDEKRNFTEEIVGKLSKKKSEAGSWKSENTLKASFFPLPTSHFRLPTSHFDFYTILSAQEVLAKASGLALNTKPIPRI